MEYEKLTAIISELFHIDPEEITPESAFIDDFGADSLDLFQLILKIEEEFGLEIPTRTLEGIVTVSDAEKLLKGEPVP